MNMLSINSHLLMATSFMPHGMCYLWKPWLVGLHVVSNAAIASSYFSIPLTLVHIVRKRQDIPFNWIPLLFAAFIICCGAGHLLDVWTLWHPNYWLSGYVRAITGLVSVATAIALVYLIPQILSFPSHTQIEATNQRLVAEIQEREQVQRELAKLNQELEARVQRRTSELEIANQRKDELIIQERSYRQQIELYKYIFDYIPLGFCVWNLENIEDINSFRLVTANSAACQILDLQLQTNPGKLMGEYFPNMIQEYRPLLEVYADVAINREAKVISDAQYGDSHIDTSFYSLRVFPIPDGYSIGVAFEDITERKRIEIALAQSEQLYKSVINNVDEVIFQTDTQGNWTFLSPAWETITGFTPEASLQHHLTELIATATAKQQLQELFTSLIDDLKQTYKVDISIFNALGELRWLEMYAQTKTDHLGQVIGAWGTLNDITERKQSEAIIAQRAEELAEINQQLVKITTEVERRNAELDQFAYVTSHDLKAPLRAIANLSEWLEEDLEDKLTDDTRHQMNLLRSRVHRMEALINGILQYSRIGRTTTELEKVDISQLLLEIIDSLSPPSEFRIEITSEMPVITTERLPLQMVFSNLISNGIKHHPRTDGSIKICSQDMGNYLEFSITDDGLGIAPEFQEKIFSIFQTLDSRDHTENTGIGLSIVKKIVENQGGIIKLVSQPNQGANFLFTWKK